MGFVNEWDRDGEVGMVGGLDADAGSVAPYETGISANKFTWRWGKEPTGGVNIQTLIGGTTFITQDQRSVSRGQHPAGPVLVPARRVRQQAARVPVCGGALK